tara:strand:- start:1830 stop:2411 length:582 start_codon:yes stop_codon:yes gene_type:complete
MENNYILQTTPLFIFILLISGNYIGELLPCKVQYFVSNNIYFKHLLGFMTLLFFVVITMPTVFGDRLILNSSLLYLFYLFFINTYYKIFIFNVVIFAFIYLVDIYLGNMQNQSEKEETDDKSDNKILFEKIRYVLLWVIITTTLLGFLIYLGNKKREYGKKFNYLTFIFGKPSCLNKSPKITSYLEEIKYAFR